MCLLHARLLDHVLPQDTAFVSSLVTSACNRACHIVGTQEVSVKCVDVLVMYLLPSRKFRKSEKYMNSSLHDPTRHWLMIKNYYQVGISNSFMVYIDLIN